MGAPWKCEKLDRHISPYCLSKGFGAIMGTALVSLS